MKILKNQGHFEILSKTEDIISIISKAARTCYQSQDKSSKENDLKLVKNLMKRQHYAMLEFPNLIVRFSDVSRGFTHEMVRHRHCSFAQESTRYVDESDLHVIVPPHKDENINIDLGRICKTRFTGGTNDLNLDDWFKANESIYSSLIKEGWKPEDARQVLPIATRSQIVVGGNMRQWRHVFKMRCDHFAHWEIRGVMLELLHWCKENIPIIFNDFKFFTTDDGKEYARKVMSPSVLKDEIKHYVECEHDADDLMYFIKNLKMED
ncbi:MAG: FAD-dependent thymidylate synthase [Elusimicrobiota bacterium]